MFTPSHFIWLGISTLIIVALILLDKKFKFNFKVATYIVAGISLLSELVKIFTHIFPSSRWEYLFEGTFKGNPDGIISGYYLLPKSLPFHVCSILIFLFFYLVFAKNEKRIEVVKSFVVPFSIIGGFLAIVTANGISKSAGWDNFKDPSVYQTFIYHTVILWYGIYLMKSKQVKLGLKEWVRNSVVLFALMICLIWVNSFLIEYEVNFFFLVYPPMDAFRPIIECSYFLYFMCIYLAFVIVIGIINLPYIIKEIKAKNE